MIGWLDCQAGVSGDMLLGALVDAGVPLEVLQKDIDALGVDVVLEASAVERAGLRATKVDVRAPDMDQPHRTWSDVRALLDRLPAPALPLEVFRRLAEAEGSVHGVPPEDVHFHEVGALDALADVVGVCAGFRHLALERLLCSPVALGSGTARSAHGAVPVPVPAVLALLEGAPVQSGPAPFESATPTGAALLATLVDEWGALPPVVLDRSGTGAGTRDTPGTANVVRLVLGTAGAASTTEHLLEANVDDLDPRLWPAVLQRLLDAGAADAWLTPILMKKGRPAHTLSVLVTGDSLPAVRDVVFRETTTLGLRMTAVAKHALERGFSQVEVDGEPIRVKSAWYAGQLVTSTPEWEDVARAAEALGRPVREVMAAAVAAAQTSAKNASAPSPPASGTPTQS